MTSNNFERPPYKGLTTRFRQFCAPVGYRSLTVLFSPKDNSGVRMVLLRNMVIANCDCLEVVEFSESTS